ncbi:ATP-dependent DNA helicase RecG [Thiomicrorhabdus aquaedulcis]|uniref:ATP-dependent DNA helicase RecG n=1 Tax=Thiomicrorhabdus aquaedulcis TaxID=2211106 RepID=UPI000FDBACC7|nr:ATP-dependent DNA helicase RecG [Thiomicrorhabdus aquaedulcis]
MLALRPLTALKGVGPKQLEKLHKLGLFVVQDLLFHLPLRYQDKTHLTPIDNLYAGAELLVEGEVFAHTLTSTRAGRRNSLLVKLIAPSGATLTLRFFHFHPAQAKQFSRGKVVRVFGEVRLSANGFEMVHPSIEFINPNVPPALSNTLTPVYPTCEGLGQISLLKLMVQALAELNQNPLADLLPNPVLDTLELPSLNHALLTLHQPQPEDDLSLIKQFKHPAQQRLIIEELITHQVALQQLRQQEQTRFAPQLPASRLCNALLTSLPFELTQAQQRVLQQIQHDLAQPHPMQRLVQGDVGSGKTVVAALAAIQAADAGYQVAIMAPTEILAEQHLNAFSEWLNPLDIEVTWLNGRMKAAEKRFRLAQIESGDAKVVIGTHALFQDAVEFNRLGLVVIDEQHRFGVHQRLSLHQKGHRIVLEGAEDLENAAEVQEPQEAQEVPKNLNSSSATAGQFHHPHQLIMTATPIPRTLAMTAYGDLDLSVIDELPPGRKPIDTAVLSNTKRTEVMAHLVAKCAQGVQAYWVCPLIEESELLHAQAAEVTANYFIAHYPHLRVGLIHGRLKGEQKALVMNAFKAHQLDLLVATTVIEVGVNVPNASLMIIENAERLGLAQLHQLRGRVGRGDKQSHCVLLYQAPLSATAKARLNIMRQTNDGFIIAEEDLRIRGPGDVLGTHQTGTLHFRIADLRRDSQWVDAALHWAKYLVQTQSPAIEALQARWVGQKIDYQHA